VIDTTATLRARAVRYGFAESEEVTAHFAVTEGVGRISPEAAPRPSPTPPVSAFRRPPDR
jgi:hypothetical protein